MFVRRQETETHTAIHAKQQPAVRHPLIFTHKKKLFFSKFAEFQNVNGKKKK